MPFALLFVGLLLVISGFQDTYKELGSQLQSDFTGSGNFTYWIIAIGIVGSLGYIDELKTLSRLFMALIILDIFISNRGVFKQFNTSVASGDSAAVNPIGTPLQGSSGGGSGSTSSSAGGIISDVSTAASIASLF